jgi:Protein of unknown function (DUF2961)
MKSCGACLFALVFGLVSLTRAQEVDANRSDGLFDQLFLLKHTETRRISSADERGGNTDWVVIAPGETKTLAKIPGAGVIRRFYLSPWAPDRMRYRKLTLRMYWDGQPQPCVELPLGDLFGSGLGTLRHFRSLPINVNQGRNSWDFDGMVSYFPMPFEKGARITLENDGRVEDFRIWYHIDYEEYPAGTLPENAGRFHAHWRRIPKTTAKEGQPKNSTLGNAEQQNVGGEGNYVILDTTGWGSYVGFFLTIDNIAGDWYGEGDDMIFVDGAKWPPTYAGTGTEEIFNAGCCPTTEFAGPYTGFYLIENLNGDWGGKNQMYRFLINDPVHFEKSIRVTLEHGHNNNFENDYSSTAFWYQKDPHTPFPPMLSARERLPRWSREVEQALNNELQATKRLTTALFAQELHLSKEKEEELRQASERRNDAFRALRYTDFIREVGVLQSFVDKNLNKGPVQALRAK